MYLLQFAQFFGHLVDALLLFALFSHGAVTSLSACATTGAVRSPEPLTYRAGLTCHEDAEERPSGSVCLPPPPLEPAPRGEPPGVLACCALPGRSHEAVQPF